MHCDISVQFRVAKHAYDTLQKLASQNQAVLIKVNKDATITLTATMLDFTELPEEWDMFE